MNLPYYLSIKDEHLYYENIDLTELVEKYPTPLEVAYVDNINSKIKKLKDIFSHAIEKHNYSGKYYYAYATKANYYSEVVATSTNYADYLETSSGYDLDIIEKLCVDRIIDKDYPIICNGFKKGYYYNKILELKKAGFNLIVVIDSVDEYELFKNQENNIDIGIRLNIDTIKNETAISSGRLGSSYDTRFGMKQKEIQYVLEDIKNVPNLKLKLLHFHLGGVINNINSFMKIVEKSYKKYYCIIKKQCKDLEYFDFGGGLPVQYDFEFSFNYSEFAEKIIKVIQRISKKEKVECPNLIGEHGRYTVADHGFFIYKINLVKEIKNNEYWYLIDSSLMNYLPDAWALGQDFIVMPLNLMNNRRVKVRLGGITCDPDDTYYKQEHKNYINLPVINDGEELYIGIFGVGAYQEMIAGIKGVHHCMIPEGNELLIEISDGKPLYNFITGKQSSKDMLKLLDYTKSHNLQQYSNKYSFHLTENVDELLEDYNSLFVEFPADEIFPYVNIKKAIDKGQYKVYHFYENDRLLGKIFVALLPKTKMIVINYIYILKQYRNQGYGHIMMNRLKSEFLEYNGMLVEVEPVTEDKIDSIKTKRMHYYKDNSFIEQNVDYYIYGTESKNYIPMKVLIFNSSKNGEYMDSLMHLKNIFCEYYNALFDDEGEKQFRLNGIIE